MRTITNVNNNRLSGTPKDCFCIWKRVDRDFSVAVCFTVGVEDSEGISWNEGVQITNSIDLRQLELFVSKTIKMVNMNKVRVGIPKEKPIIP